MLVHHCLEDIRILLARRKKKERMFLWHHRSTTMKTSCFLPSEKLLSFIKKTIGLKCQKFAIACLRLNKQNSMLFFFRLPIEKNISSERFPCKVTKSITLNINQSNSSDNVIRSSIRETVKKKNKRSTLP